MERISDYINKVVNLTPSKIAILDGDNKITYKSLSERIYSFANKLISLNVKEGSRIAIILENSISHIICSYGAIIASCVFVPLPVNLPLNKLNELIVDSNPNVIVTDAFLYNELSLLRSMNNVESYFIVDQDLEIREKICENGLSSLKNVPVNDACSYIEASNLERPVYILYTSGSTGKPKGVVINYRSLLNFIETTIKLYFQNNSVYLNMLPFNFDGSFTGLFCALMAGSQLVISKSININPAATVKCCIDNKITIFGCTPSFLDLFLKSAKRQNESEFFLRTITVGGDFIKKETLNLFFSIFKKTRLFNRYGPTETTSVVSNYEITERDLETDISIGKPVNNTFFRFLGDEDNNTGELLIGGIQIMQGYWNDKELTEKSFVKIDEMMFYKSGDYAMKDEYENYFLLGRSDSMIKHNGYRVFLPEVEANLFKTGLVKCPVCVYHNSKLIAFVVLNNSENNKFDVIRELKKYAASYMMPDYIKLVESIPYTKIGKVDKKILLDSIGGLL